MADLAQHASMPAATRPSFSVVPLRGLPAAGAVLLLLIGAIAGNWLWALDFFHVVGGGMWTALDLFLGFVIGPTVRRLPAPARVDFTTRS